MAWPAFAYSIEDDREAQRTYSFVLTYVVFVCCWLALALGLLAPWIVRLASFVGIRAYGSSRRKATIAV